VLNFFETLRMELRDEVGITIATPRWIESEITKGKHLSKEGTVEVDQDMRDVSPLDISESVDAFSFSELLLGLSPAGA